MMWNGLRTAFAATLLGLAACGPLPPTASDDASALAGQGIPLGDPVWLQQSAGLTLRLTGGMPQPDGTSVNQILRARIDTMSAAQLAAARSVRRVEGRHGLCAEDWPDVILTVTDRSGQERRFRSHWNKCKFSAGRGLPLVEHDALLDLYRALGGRKL